MRPTRVVRTSALVLSTAVLGALLVAAPGDSSVYAQDPFGQLVGRVPRSANAIVILNVEKMLASPMGVREGWKADHEKAYDAGLMRVPPVATRFVLASQIDFEFQEPIWEAAVMDVGETVSLEEFAKKRGGKLDSVSGQAAVALPTDVYVVQLAPRMFGAMAPANRQAVSRWLREAESNQQLSSYLQKAAVYSDAAGTEIIMAVDLEDVVGARQVEDYLKDAELPDEAKKDVASLTGLLSGIRGVRLGIRIGSQPAGKLAVDFRDDVSMSPELGKTLLLNVLADDGMRIQDMDDWRASVKGTEFALQGNLTKEGLRRVLSVIDSPAPNELEGQPAQAEISTSDEKAEKAAKSQEYFKAVVSLVEGIGPDMKGNLANLSSMSLWFDKYAKRIERLPMLGVDPDLLEYSAYVTRQLRNASKAVRGMGIRSSVRQSQITSADTAPYAYGGSRYGRYGAYGGYGGASNWAVYSPAAEARAVSSERRKVRYEERGAMASNVHVIRDEITQATSDMRRLMTERYQIEF